jgi:hypothetical protein
MYLRDVQTLLPFFTNECDCILVPTKNKQSQLQAASIEETYKKEKLILVQIVYHKRSNSKEPVLTSACCHY